MPATSDIRRVLASGTTRGDGRYTTLATTLLSGGGTANILLADATDLPAGTDTSEPGTLTVVDKDDSRIVYDVFYDWTSISGNTLIACKRLYNDRNIPNGALVMSALNYSLWLQTLSVLETVETTVNDAIPSSEKGLANGVATLSSDAKQSISEMRYIHLNPGYDYIICPSNVTTANPDYGVYNSIRTALEANQTAYKRFKLEPGSNFVETSLVTLRDNQLLISDHGVTLELNGAGMRANAGSRLRGPLKITGTGEATNRILLNLAGFRADFCSEGSVEFVPVGDGLTVGSSGVCNPCIVTANECCIDAKFQNLAFVGTSLLLKIAASFIRIRFVAKSLTHSGSGTSLQALRLENASFDANVAIDSIVSSNGSAWGIYINSALDGSIRGYSYLSTTANVGGTTSSTNLAGLDY